MLINRDSYEKSNPKNVSAEELEKQALAHLRNVVARDEFAGMPPENVAAILNMSFPRTPSIFHQHFAGVAHVENAVTAEDVINALKG